MNNEDYNNLKTSISKYNKALWLPNNDIKLININNNTWFNFDKYENPDIKYINKKLQIPKCKHEQLIKCKKIEMKLNNNQKEIFNIWFKSYILMYNKTLKFIKNKFKNKEKLIIDYKYIRTYHLKKIRDDIIKESQYNKLDKDTTIKTHILDTAIQLACANYKSAITNIKNKNIKHYKIKYWRFNKSNKILDIEKCYFRKNELCPKVFGKITYIYNNKEYKLDEINSTCKVIYEKSSKKYSLLIPIKIDQEEIIHKKNFISIDPGIRTFITGISENEIINIGDNLQSKIEVLLNKKDKILKLQIKKIIKKKISERLTRKIKYLINELHWKSIKYLTDNYKNILIGDLSVKGIVNNRTSVITSMTKRIGLHMSLFKFKERLQYKCNVKNNNYIEVNERYTSKMCSNCSNYKEDLGANKVYNCNNCKKIIDRDINAARNIYIKTLK